MAFVDPPGRNDIPVIILALLLVVLASGVMDNITITLPRVATVPAPAVVVPAPVVPVPVVPAVPVAPAPPVVVAPVAGKHYLARQPQQWQLVEVKQVDANTVLMPTGKACTIPTLGHITTVGSSEVGGQRYWLVEYGTGTEIRDTTPPTPYCPYTMRQSLPEATLLAQFAEDNPANTFTTVP